MKYRIVVTDCYNWEYRTETDCYYSVDREAKKLVNSLHEKDKSTSCYRVTVYDTENGNMTNFMVFK